MRWQNIFKNWEEYVVRSLSVTLKFPDKKGQPLLAAYSAFIAGLPVEICEFLEKYIKFSVNAERWLKGEVLDFVKEQKTIDGRRVTVAYLRTASVIQKPHDFRVLIDITGKNKEDNFRNISVEIKELRSTAKIDFGYRNWDSPTGEKNGVAEAYARLDVS